MSETNDIEANTETSPKLTYWQEYYRTNREKIMKQRMEYNRKFYEKNKNEDWFKERKSASNKRYNEKAKERKQAEKETMKQRLERLELLDEQLNNSS